MSYETPENHSSVEGKPKLSSAEDIGKNCISISNRQQIRLHAVKLVCILAMLNSYSYTSSKTDSTYASQLSTD